METMEIDYLERLEAEKYLVVCNRCKTRRAVWELPPTKCPCGCFDYHVERKPRQ